MQFDIFNSFFFFHFQIKGIVIMMNSENSGPVGILDNMQ